MVYISNNIIKDLYETEIPSLILTEFMKSFKENKLFYKIRTQLFNFLFLCRSSNDEYFTSSLYIENKKKGLSLLNDIYSRQLKNNYLRISNTKTKGEINYSNRKLWKQKGTGQARIGSRKSIHLRGGGVSFGPRFKTIKYKINKKIKKQLIYNIFFLQKKKLKLISQNINLENFFKTKDILNYLKFNLLSKKTKLILVSNKLENINSKKLKLLLNNVPNILVIKMNDLNIKHCLHFDEIYILENAITELIARLI